LSLSSNTTTEKLFIEILEALPELCSLRNNAILALNQNYLEGGFCVVLREGDELAFIPPISGG